MADSGFKVKIKESFAIPGLHLEFFMTEKVNAPLVAGNESWKFSAAAKLVTVDDTILKAAIDKEFNFYSPNENYGWVNF